MNKKIMSLFVVGIFLLATLGSVSAEKQNTYARNPSIQNSKYYVLEFSIESNAEEAFLVLDGEKHEMFNENGKYVCRTSFKEGNHEYYFELDGKRLPEKGFYKISEVERRWILLNSLIGHLTWKPDKERVLENRETLTKKQELYQILSIKSATLACISGLTKRMAINSMKAPQNFDISKIMKSLKATDLGKRGTFDITKSTGLLDLSQTSYTFALELAKRTEIVSTGLELGKTEKMTIQDIKELARNYGYKADSVLEKEEIEGYSVAGLYTSGEVHPDIDITYEGYYYYLRVDAYWGQPHWWLMDYEFWAYTHTDYYPDYIDISSVSYAGRDAFIPATKVDGGVMYLRTHRESTLGWWLGQWMTQVWVGATYDDSEELSTILTLNLYFAMGY